MDKLPSFSSDLIKMLDEAYPDRCPSINLSDREVWFKAGQRSVVNKLLSLSREEDGQIPNLLE